MFLNMAHRASNCYFENDGFCYKFSCFHTRICYQRGYRVGVIFYPWMGVVYSDIFRWILELRCVLTVPSRSITVLSRVLAVQPVSWLFGWWVLLCSHMTALIASSAAI